MEKRGMLYFADLDMRTVLQLKNISGLEDSCIFHCEQMVEKLLKHLLIMRTGKNDYRHRPTELVRQLDLEIELKDYLSLIQELQDSYFDRRYETSNYVVYSKEEYEEIIESSLSLYKLLLSIINKNNMSYRSSNNKFISKSSVFNK